MQTRKHGVNGRQTAAVISVLVAKHADRIYFRIGVYNAVRRFGDERRITFHADQSNGSLRLYRQTDSALAFLAVVPIQMPGAVAVFKDGRHFRQRAERVVKSLVHRGQIGLHVNVGNIQRAGEPIETVRFSIGGQAIFYFQPGHGEQIAQRIFQFDTVEATELAAAFAFLTESIGVGEFLIELRKKGGDVCGFRAREFGRRHFTFADAIVNLDPSFERTALVEFGRKALKVEAAFARVGVMAIHAIFFEKCRDSGLSGVRG